MFLVIMTSLHAAPDELVAISNDTSLIVGDTALLVCVGYGQPNVEISWTLNGEVVMNGSLITIYEEEVSNRERLFKQSFLELSSLEVANSGVYTCTVSNGRTIVNATTQLSVSGKYFNSFLDNLTYFITCSTR